jgi:carbonic anhydrase
MEEEIMKMRSISILFFGLSVSGLCQSTESTHWGYTGQSGPDHWGELSEEFAVCSSGKNQSPIDLSGMIEGDLPPLAIDYKTGGDAVINNGHTIKINYTPGSTMTVSGQSYELKQVHFHSPSENIVKGQSYPMEAHFVHADKNGNLAVIAVFYDNGKANGELEKAWMSMPNDTGKAYPLYDHVNADQLLPANRDYYRFNGSLTTPPCSEGVKWFVMKEIGSASKEQVDKFSKVMHHANNRPVQPINARIVIQ